MKKILNILLIVAFVFMLFTTNTYAYNNYVDTTIDCGNGLEFSRTIPNVSYYFILVIEIAAPITIVVFGMFDLAKSIPSGKEEDIKKAQGTLIKRIIAGVCVFFVIAITKFVVNVFADNNVGNCLNCFLNGPTSCGK